jgi:TM2 domain-containing membrane protein YozV
MFAFHVSLFHALRHVPTVLALIGCMAASGPSLVGAMQASGTAASGQSVGLALNSTLPATALNEVYTDNALCRQNNCVNPLIPGLTDLAQLETLVWQCSTNWQVGSFLDFCKGAIYYDPALPSPNSSAQLVQQVVKSQDDAAATMFFYHLNGMGYEAWEHPKPHESEDECVRSVWNMVCFTYFPKADSACKSGEQSAYRRPCSGACNTYLSACKVECCDESPQCVFTHKEKSGGQEMIQTGYYDDAGPSAYCTGHTPSGARGLRIPGLALLFGILCLHLSNGMAGVGAEASAPPRSGAAATDGTNARKRRGWSGRQVMLGACFVLCAITMQGCNLAIPKHNTGNWRQKQDFLVSFEYVSPGQSNGNGQLNSCAIPDLSPAEQCSGRGYCKAWGADASSSLTNPVSFCVCDPAWADPECRTKRKSQLVTFGLSVFFGMFGADYFYLGYPLWGLAKLFTAGGLGCWWLLDIVRVGSGPLYAYNYRVNNDLPHWVFMLATVALAMLCGFGFALESYFSYRKKKFASIQNLKESEEERALGNKDLLEGPRSSPGVRSMAGRVDFQGYGSMLPRAVPTAGAPYAEAAAY